MNILLITDDTSIISMVKHTLKKSGSDDRLFVARSGRDGIDYLNKALNSQLDLIPSLLILDFDSEEANGLYVIQRVTTDLKIQGMQVAVLTEELEERDAEHLERRDLEYIIEKPLEHKMFQELFDAMEQDEPAIVGTPGAVPYREPKVRISDEGELRRVLIVETSLAERKRLNAAIRRGAANTLTFDFATSWVVAKRQVRKEGFGAIVLSVSEKDVEKAIDILETSRERLNTPVIVLVEPGDEELGKAAVVAGANIFLVRDSGNFISVLLELLTNMVERRRLEILAKRNNDADKEMLREVIERAPLMVLRVDDSFAIKDCNETFATASKQLRHALIGKHIFDILPDLEILPMISVLEDGAAYSREGYRMKTIGQTHTATTYWDFHVWSIRRTVTSGQEAILVAADVSGRIELEQQRERFVAALAHDIRNPLVGGQRVLDAILGGKHGELEPPRAKQLVVSLQKSNQSLLLMLSNLIDVYKFETASMSLSFTPLDFAAVVREQIGDVAHVAASADVELVEDIPDDLPEIPADLNSIKRLLMNLLHNALKYCQPKSKIEVRLWAVGTAMVTIRIRNTGNPIAAEKMRSLFRNVVDGVPVRHGSGLGLYLCRRIADAHNASIEYRCTADGVTDVLVRFPNANADESQFAVG